MKKHRLVLLLGILVALIFFYLGLNTWMASQEQQSAPPPVVRSKPPVQIKPPAQPVKPQPPAPAAPKVEEETPKPKVVKLTPTEPKKEEKKVEEKPKPQVKKAEEKPKPKVQKPKEVKKEIVKREEEPKPKKVSVKKEKPKSLREYVVQIGAFKSKDNADKSLKLARSKGFDAFIIEEEGLYKVRVRVKAKSLLSALREVRGEFKNAFIVR